MSPVLFVRCQTCGAPRGRSCIRFRGYWAGVPTRDHRRRIEDAERHLRAKVFGSPPAPARTQKGGER